MILLLLGVGLWAGAHVFKRLAPAQRAKVGDKGKGLVAVLTILAIVLMVIGYRGADFVPIWEPPTFLRHVNNLLMVLAFYVYGVGATKGLLSARIHHPQLAGFKIWAIAHLLVNGDLASVILFGGLLIWAFVQTALIDRAVPWVRPETVSIKGDFTALVIGLVLMSIVAAIHIWLGVNPFGG